jgi:hypothetical protein
MTEAADRDAALLLDLHPVRPRPPVLAPRPHGAGGTNGAAGQQDMLGQGRLARIRVGDDGEGATAGRFFRQGQ